MGGAELEYHPYVLAHLDPILKIQEQHNIVTEAYGPLTPILRHPSGGPLKPILARIAKRLGTSPSGVKVDEGTVLLLWTMAKGVVAVTASTKVENLKKMSEIQTWGDLTAEEIKEIEEAGRKVHFRGYKVGLTTGMAYGDAELMRGRNTCMRISRARTFQRTSEYGEERLEGELCVALDKGYSK
jgi:diketogulonate reductase-like aldo/keto reductase